MSDSNPMDQYPAGATADIHERLIALELALASHADHPARLDALEAAAAPPAKSKGKAAAKDPEPNLTEELPDVVS